MNLGSRSEADDATPRTGAFSMELTNGYIFVRKLLKFYFQSFLLGVPVS